jgi:hypothetical protein
VRDPSASAGLRVHVPIGIGIPEQGCRPGLIPHRAWHWGPSARWVGWAPLGGLGLISHHGPEAEARRQVLTQGARDQLWLPEVIGKRDPSQRQA